MHGCTRLLSLGLVMAMLALTGCGAINMVYNNAPAFVAGEFDDAFDLSEEQRVRLDAGLQRFFGWHRQHELPRYRLVLENAAQSIADGISADELLAIGDELQQAWRRSVTRMIDDVGDLAPTLTPKQIDQFQEYYHDRSEKYRDYLEMTLQQREISRVERRLERLEDWFGKFDYFERQRVEQRLSLLPIYYPAWIAYRQARQQALVAALRGASTEGLSKQRLQAIFLDDDSDYARAFEPVRDAYWRAGAQMIEDMSSWLSKAQLGHAVERLQYYAEICEELIKDE